MNAGDVPTRENGSVTAPSVDSAPPPLRIVFAGSPDAADILGQG